MAVAERVSLSGVCAHDSPAKVGSVQNPRIVRMTGIPVLVLMLHPSVTEKTDESLISTVCRHRGSEAKGPASVFKGSHRSVPLWPQLAEILRAYLSARTAQEVLANRPTQALLFPRGRHGA